MLKLIVNLWRAFCEYARELRELDAEIQVDEE